MSATDFGFVGWMKDEEENHDKVWGYFYRPTSVERPANHPYRWFDPPTKQQGWNCVVFWGRRGKAMQFKAMQFKAGVTGYDLDKLVDSKKRKGYVQINSAHLTAIWPSFEEEKNLKLSFEVLAGNVK